MAAHLRPFGYVVIPPTYLDPGESLEEAAERLRLMGWTVQRPEGTKRRTRWKPLDPDTEMVTCPICLAPIAWSLEPTPGTHGTCPRCETEFPAEHLSLAAMQAKINDLLLDAASHDRDSMDAVARATHFRQKLPRLLAMAEAAGVLPPAWQTPEAERDLALRTLLPEPAIRLLRAYEAWRGDSPPGLEALEVDAGMSRKTVIKYRKILVKKGWLTVHSDGTVTIQTPR